MITPPSNFTTENAKLAKEPLHIVQVGSYPTGMAFSNSRSIPQVWPQLGIGALVGAFTDGTGQVIQPLAVGNGMVLTVPVGATQLQLGNNEEINFLGGGTLSVELTVNGAKTTVTVPATATPWV